MRRPLLLLLALLVGALVLPVAPARAASPLKTGSAFVPKPQSKPLYGMKPPSENPEKQTHVVEAADGVDLYVETWLPAPKNGKTPPNKLPTILIMTPYVQPGVQRYTEEDPTFIEYMTARGYAVAQHHVRGTGASGGCLEQTADDQISDGALVVEYLGKDAPWTNGRVGMFGRSYDAETQISTAGYGDPEKLKYLKALIPVASVGSQYDWNFMDGVPWEGQPAIGNVSYLLTSLEPGDEVNPIHFAQRFECQAQVMPSSADVNGDYTAYWQEREYRPGAPRIDAATFYVHGLRDFNVQPITLAGWFDELSNKTPHKGLFGVWGHRFPGNHAPIEPDWTRADWMDMVTAWYDRYLKGHSTGVGSWPNVQVQSSDGQWWVAREFPKSGRPFGQLGLGPDNSLGVTKPTGSSSYTEQTETGEAGADEQIVFSTKPLEGPMQITGQPVLETWIQTNTGDGHVAVELEVLGKNGEPLQHKGPDAEAVATYGVRSLQHRQPMKRGFFEQKSGSSAPMNEPFRTKIRFLPTDLTVPAGGKLRLTISGSVSYAKGSSMTSGVPSEITVMHNCKNPSVLRFLMPNKKSKLLNVREPDETGKLASAPKEMGRRDGRGMATAEVCGQKPQPSWWLTGNFPKELGGDS
jgi:X-Pro dipeptidyl-peptidase